MKRKTIGIIVFSITITAGVAYAARSLRDDAAHVSEPADDSVNGAEEEMATAGAVKPVVVKTMAVEPTSFTERVKVSGITAPIREVTFSAEVPGKIEYVGADIGDTVRKGQVLARIDFETLRAEKSRAESAFSLAESTYRRLLSLGDEIVTRQKLDEAYAAMVTARAGLDIAENGVQKSVIRSTVRGVVTAAPAERGEFATPGTPLVHVVDYRTVVVEAQLPESVVAAVADEAAVTVLVDALGEAFTGKVDTLLPLADAASGTFTVRVELDNADLTILPGMSATVLLNMETHDNVVVLPQDLIVESRDGRSVFVADGNKAKRRRVTLGATDRDRVVVASGVAAGDRVVVVGHRNLADGQPITIAN